MIWWMVMGATVAWAGDCPSSVPLSELEEAVSGAESAVLSGDIDATQARLADLSNLLPCLSEPASPAFAARLHRIQGIAAFLKGDESDALPAFLAARLIEPGAPLLPGGGPSAGPIAEAYRTLNTSLASWEAVAAPADAELLLDGSADLERGVDLPVLFQLMPAEGAPTVRYLPASAPLPEYSLAGASASVAAPSEVDPPASGPRRPMLFTGIGGVVASGVLYGLAWQANQDFEDLRAQSDVTFADASAAQARVNRRSAAAVGGFGVSVALVGGAFALGAR